MFVAIVYFLKTLGSRPAIPPLLDLSAAAVRIQNRRSSSQVFMTRLPRGVDESSVRRRRGVPGPLSQGSPSDAHARHPPRASEICLFFLCQNYEEKVGKWVAWKKWAASSPKFWSNQSSRGKLEWGPLRASAAGGGRWFLGTDAVLRRGNTDQVQCFEISNWNLKFWTLSCSFTNRFR